MGALAALRERASAELRPRIGTRRRRLLAHPLRTRRQLRALARDAALPEEDRALLAGVSPAIAPADEMYEGNGDHYFRVGLGALRRVEEALASAGAPATGPRSILDLPCGHGRVLRFLARRFPAASLTACDLDRGGVDFCAAAFGATPVYSSERLDEVRLPGGFDLAWCGSLVTHLDEQRTLALLGLFRDQLAPGGVLVLSTHGDHVAQMVRERNPTYVLPDDRLAALAAGYERDGFSYVDYPWASGYGVSLSSPAWIRARVAELGGLREVMLAERGWDDHHDVFGFVRER